MGRFDTSKIERIEIVAKDANEFASRALAVVKHYSARGYTIAEQGTQIIKLEY